MYWPVATPRIYATSSQASSRPKVVLSHDGTDSANAAAGDNASLLSQDSALFKPAEDSSSEATPALLTPTTPGLFSPRTPGINAVDHDIPLHASAQSSQENLERPTLPSGEPIISLKVSRNGHMFATVTASSMTVWQTKVRWL
jgi:RAB6A-GEF complex partner protein 1